MKLRGVRCGDGIVDLDIDAGVFAAPVAGRADLSGGMITPVLAEPHVHLDAVLLAGRAPNVSGTLREGIASWARLRGELTPEDVRARALTVVGWYVGWGCRKIRTHADTGCPAAVEALLALREELRGTADLGCPELQVVAFPQEGILRAPGRERAWLAAVEAGCDAVGAIPHFERTAGEGARSLAMACALAAERGLQVDVHCDETDDPGSRHLEVLCAETEDRGLGGRVVAGHCTAMHSYPAPHAAKVIELVRQSGVQVVANPLDNVVLQGRYDGYPKRRGLTRIDELWAAGAAVGIGHDSVMDPWYALGTANLMDAASMAVHLGHLTGTDQMRRAARTLWRENHLPFGAAPEIAVGAAADFLWWPVADEVEALRLRPRPRMFVGGREILGADRDRT